MRRRSSILVIVIGLAAVVAAAILSMHPPLSDAREEAEQAWSSLQTPLEERFDHLAALSRAVRDARPDGPDLLDAVDEAISGWKTFVSERPTPDIDTEPAAAVRVESAGARLATAILASPRLAENRQVVEALNGFIAADPQVERARYNDAVDRYDSARARFPGRFFADLLGFEGVRTVTLPVALEDIELPGLPPAPAPEEPAEDAAEEPAEESAAA